MPIKSLAWTILIKVAEVGLFAGLPAKYFVI
jgi:hypothetical protein